MKFLVAAPYNIFGGLTVRQLFNGVVRQGYQVEMMTLGSGLSSGDVEGVVKDAHSVARMYL